MVSVRGRLQLFFTPEGALLQTEHFHSVLCPIRRGLERALERRRTEKIRSGKCKSPTSAMLLQHPSVSMGCWTPGALGLLKTMNKKPEEGLWGQVICMIADLNVHKRCPWNMLWCILLLHCWRSDLLDVSPHLLGYGHTVQAVTHSYCAARRIQVGHLKFTTITDA